MEATFETLVDAFVLLDKNKDGYVSKNEMVQAINESGERSSGPIATKRFGQLSLSLYIYILIVWYIIHSNFTRIEKCILVIVKKKKKKTKGGEGDSQDHM